MRPTPVAHEAASTSLSRKSSIVADRRPSISSNQPTSFFLAREEDVFGPTTKKSSRRSSASQRSDGRPPLPADDSSMNMGSEVKAGQQDSMYGVQSLEETLGQAFEDEEKEHDTTSGFGFPSLLKRKRGKAPAMTSAESSPDKHLPVAGASTEELPSKQSSPRHREQTSMTQRSRTNTISQPLTPLRLESPMPESTIPGTPHSGSFRSLRLSDEEDDAVSQAITSGGEDEDEEDAPLRTSGVAPELVMPSLSMPSRRPFTEKGKQMGRLKIAVAGANGVGKTSLIRAIVRQCEDIVHLDPITTPAPTLITPQPGKPRPKRPASATTHVTEIQASTRAYPAWWSEMEDSRVLRRRKSLNETVLERNICFIDSPGYDTKGNVQWEQQALLRYLDSLCQKTLALMDLSKEEVVSVLSGAGGMQIDVVLFVCQSGESVSQHDFEYMTHLSKYASIVPIITRADASPEAELERRRTAVQKELPRCGVNASLLSRAPMANEPQQTPMPQDQHFSTYLGRPHTQAPFLVSCLPGSDDGEMDASLLMSPSYTPPLVPSELQSLVTSLFDPENMIKLRHISARKFLLWRDRLASSTPSSSLTNVGGPVSTHLALRRASTSASTSAGALVPRSSISPFNLSSTASSIGATLPAYTQARVRDHVAREERLALVQLARWASDLQGSLRREREEYTRLVEGERAKWLLERVGEQVALGAIQPYGSDYSSDTASSNKPGWALTKQERRSLRRKNGAGMQLPSWARRGELDRTDPLGLCVAGDVVARTGGAVLKILGGGVLVGAVWMAVCRAWGWDAERGLRVGWLVGDW